MNYESIHRKIRHFYMQKKDWVIVRTCLRDISREKKKLSDESRSTTHNKCYDVLRLHGTIPIVLSQGTSFVPALLYCTY